MFKLIKVDFYDEFACMMSDCPDNCCDEEWDIYIDNETLELYRKIGVPDLSDKITETEPHKLIKHNGKCPFITPEGLCIFHRDYGEDYLSNTCRSYPRFVSTYGDVYLETLGMSCPATVRHVLNMTEPVAFPSKVYYEDGDEIGKVPEMTEAENTAYGIMKCLKPSDSTISTYIQLYSEYSKSMPDLASRGHILSRIREKTIGTPSENYAGDLFPDEYINSSGTDKSVLDESSLYEIEEKLNRSNRCFSCNVNRMIMFEHLMLDSKCEVSDKGRIILQGLFAWILLLMSFERIDTDADVFSDEEMIDRTYKLMRIIDHGGSVLNNFKIFLNQGLSITDVIRYT